VRVPRLIERECLELFKEHKILNRRRVGLSSREAQVLSHPQIDDLLDNLGELAEGRDGRRDCLSSAGA
jgi:hypothetical protein